MVLRINLLAGYKTCRRCSQLLPLARFSTRASQCNPCRGQAIKESAWRRGLRKPAVVRKPAPEGFACCTKCEEMKPLGDFVMDKRIGKPYSRCKRCEANKMMGKRIARETFRNLSGLRQPGLECECGNAKQDGDVACARCLVLDGSEQIAATVISAFRVLGYEATLAALTDEAGVDERNVYRGLKLLKEWGRLRIHVPGADLTGITDHRRSAKRWVQRGYGRQPTTGGAVVSPLVPPVYILLDEPKKRAA